MENTVSPLTKMVVSTAGRVDVVQVEHLVRIEGQSNYSKLVFADGHSLVVAKVLKKFEEQLDQSHFIRPHKSHLVNLAFIRSYEGLVHKTLVLENGDNIHVARSRQSMIMRQLRMMNAV